MKTYRYAQTGVHSAPKDFLRREPRPDAGHPLHDVAVNGFLTYAYPLDIDDTLTFRLSLVLDEDGEREALRKFIDLAWRLYPDGPDRLLAFAANSPDWLRQQVGSQFKRFYPGHPPVVRDLGAFTERVLNALREESA